MLIVNGIINYYFQLIQKLEILFFKDSRIISNQTKKYYIQDKKEVGKDKKVWN